MKSYRAGLAILAVIVVASACVTSAQPQAGQGPPAGATSLTVERTAQALLDPSRATLGVWSVAAHLKVGVYDGKGHELLHGAEPIGDGHLFLYRWEIDLLAAEARNAPDSWDQFAFRLGAADTTLKLSGIQLRDGLAAAYAQHSGEFSARLLPLMKVDFKGPGSLSSFAEWVMVADNLVLHPERLPVGAPSASPPGATLLASYGAPVFRTLWLSQLHGLVVAGAFEVSIDPPPGRDLKMGPSGPGEKTQMRATVVFRLPGKAIDPPTEGAAAEYRCLLAFDYGPMKGASVTWFSQDPEFYPRWASMSQGLLTSLTGRMTGVTDKSGSSRVTVEAGEDPGHGVGPEKVHASNVVAMVDHIDARDVATCAVAGEFQKVTIWNHPDLVNLNLRYHLPSYAVTVSSSATCRGPIGLPGGLATAQGTVTGTLKPDPDHPDSFTGTGTSTGSANFATVVQGISVPIKGKLVSDGGVTRLQFGTGEGTDFVVPVTGGSATRTFECPGGQGQAVGTATPVNG